MQCHLGVVALAATMLFCACSFWWTSPRRDILPFTSTPPPPPPAVVDSLTRATVIPVQPSQVSTISASTVSFITSSSSSSPTHVRRCSVGDAFPTVSFHQVTTVVGPVPIADLAEALADLARVMEPGPAVMGGSRDGPTTQPTMFAVDGTLLNVMRWGRIVNDNDIDVGMYYSGIPFANTTQHYVLFMQALAQAGVIQAPTARHWRKFASVRLPVKPGRCLLRYQMMQCRHHNGVHIDVFGPETVFSPLTGLSPADIAPVRQCKAFANRTFPCPANGMKALKNFTLDLSLGSSGGNHRSGARPNVWYEFRGCTLLPPKEQQHHHVAAIVQDVRELRQCGFPSLWEDRCEPACAGALQSAGLQPDDCG